MRLRRVASLLALVAVPLACGPSAAPPPAAPPPKVTVTASAAPIAAEPPDGPIPALRTGALPRVDHAEVRAEVAARSVDDTFETLAIQLAAPVERTAMWELRDRGFVTIAGPGGPFAFASSSEVADRGSITVWVRRPRADQGKPIEGEIFIPSVDGFPGHRVPFRAIVDPAKKSDAKLVAHWAEALATTIRARGSSPWHAFAAERITALYGEKKPAPARGPAVRGRPARADLTGLMDTTTGRMSIQESLQADRPLLLAATRDKPTIAIGSLVPPKAAAHPWDEMLKALGRPAPREALADAVPAEFYFVRAADLGVIFQLADQLDAWGTPAARAFDQRAEEHDLARRYETQLGLARTAIARTFGNDVVADLAVAGSDPYLREGSDVSVIFRVKQRALFDAGLAATLASRGAEHGGLTTSSAQHGGVEVRLARSADGAVRQHRATVGDLEIVSNSLGATRRILDTIQGKHARLSDEKDFRFMLARDAGTRADVLAFMGDRFVGEVVGPRQKILEARRQLALAELMTPGFAALLHGWLTGKSPASVDELVASKLLAKDELKHAGGAPITWKPGAAAQSPFGTPAALTALIDLPPPDRVTEAERDAYERFSRTYETYWSTYIDPAALRVAVDTTDAGTTLTGDLRVLPLIEGTEYREVLEMAGQARVEAPPIGRGARAIIGIGREARVRGEIARLARGFSSRRELALDFLGDWAMIGCEDRASLAEAVRVLERRLPERPTEERERRDTLTAAARLPIYAAIEIKSTVGAGIALGAIRAIADDVLPAMVQWGEAGKERDVPIVRVSVEEEDDRDARGGKRRQLEIFYALTKGTFLIALNEHVLRRLIGDTLDGRGPRPAASAASGSQLLVDLSGEKQGAITTVLTWLLTQELEGAGRSSRALAEALFVGAHDRAADPAAARALALAYFGVVPVPPEGGMYALGPDGVRDPARGTESAPTWPALPVPGSAVGKLLGAVGRFGSELSFDREGAGKRGEGMLSLHAKVTLGLRPE